jgi:hypothetical protein
MRALNISAYITAFVLLAGELARFWGSARFIPMAIDEILVAALLVGAAWQSRQDGGLLHLVAWGAFCGLVLTLLVDTADHQMHGPVKSAGPAYLTILGSMLIFGMWAILRTLRLTWPARR